MLAVSVHGMFHLLLLFWKCNYLPYRGLNGDSLAGDWFHLPKASYDCVFSCVPSLSSLSCSYNFPPGRLENNLAFSLTGTVTPLATKKVNI